MKLLVDSFSFAKRYIREIGSRQLDELLQNASYLALSVILVPEILSGLNRRVGEGSMAKKDYRRAKSQLLDDVRDATILQLTPGAISRSVKLLENTTLCAMDALNVACAMAWEADLFLTSDKSQFHAAASAGLKCKYIGQPPA